MEHSIRACSIILFTLFLVYETKYIPEEGTGLLYQMPEDCTGKDFCLIKHENYPQKKIDALLSIKYPLFLGVQHQEFHDRNEPVLGEDFCEKYTDNGLIYEIVDRNDSVRVVVQSTNLFQQGITIEQCRFSGLQNINTMKNPFFPNVMETNQFSCEEKKMDINFVVLSQDGERLESVKSKNGIPVCCSCKLLNV